MIPPLPQGIPILAPGPKRTGWYVLVIVLVAIGAVWGAFALISWYSDYDKNRIDPVVSQALVDHASKGARFPVTLWGGPRLLELESVKVVSPTKSQAAAGAQAETCGLVKVIDPATGIRDPDYRGGYWACVAGLVNQTRR